LNRSKAAALPWAAYPEDAPVRWEAQRQPKDPSMQEFGYAGKILKVDLSREKTVSIPTTDYAKRFLGGRGIAAKIYWDNESSQVKAYEPDNHLIYITGPMTGFSGLASSRWQVCGKSPTMDPESFSYANLGGGWGVWLKYAGFDGIDVYGASDRPVFLFLHDGHAEIKEAASLWGQTSIDSCDALKAELGERVRTLAIGPAGENMVSFATMLSNDGSSGSGGFGAVMGSKRLKAIAISGNKKLQAADPERLRILSEHVNRLKKDSWGGHNPPTSVQLKPKPCYGCKGCFRRAYKAQNGKYFKYFCQAADVYRQPSVEYHHESNEVALMAIRLCDKYGLDTAVMQPMVAWLTKCNMEGVLREEETGLPLSKIGSAEFIEALVRRISFREGFGDLLAQGMIKTAEAIGNEARALLDNTILTRANEARDYDPRLILTNALLYATEPRRPIQQLHEVAHTLIKWLEWLKGEDGAFLSYAILRNIAEEFWGSTAAADLSTYEGKALAAKTIQDRAYVKECLILCDIFWPIKWVKHSQDHIGDPALESQVLSSVTGTKVDEENLNKVGERIFNLQRAILLRQGWGGRAGDRLLDYLHERPLESVFFDPECIVPGPKGKPISRQGQVVDRKEFEKMKSEYYELRGWDTESGLQTKAKLTELDLGDIADELERRGLVI
jgi:aldehyde:ferredoxin oxidoreductase